MKSKDNAAGFGILAILILLVLLPLAAVLFQVVCPGLQIEKFDPSNLKLVLDLSALCGKRHFSIPFS